LCAKAILERCSQRLANLKHGVGLSTIYYVRLVLSYLFICGNIAMLCSVGWCIFVLYVFVCLFVLFCTSKCIHRRWRQC